MSTSGDEEELDGAAVEAVGTAACPPPLGAAATRVPHFGQYAKSGAHGKPQPGHALGCFVPHCGQKAKPL
nr:hypothetical protein [Bradyrhizobium forestalis]